MNNKLIKFAVIGCGKIGKKHIDVILQNSMCELIALVDIKDFNSLKINKKINFYQSIKDFLKEKIIFDVAIIATPNGLHTEHALEFLKNGNNVVVEKPLSLKKTDAEKIIRKSVENKKKVFVVMQNRYSPPIKWLKKILDKGLLGNIYLINVNCFWNRDERYYNNHDWHGDKILDGGTLFTQFSHFIDIIYWLFGDIKNIDSRFFNFNHKEIIDFEDSGFINFDFVRGGSGTLNYSTSCWDKNLESSLTIIAEKGSVKLDGQYMNKIEHCHIKDYTLEEIDKTNPPNIYDGYVGSAQNHQYVIQNVINVLKNSEPIKTNALEGLKVIEIIENIYKNKNTV